MWQQGQAVSEEELGLDLNESGRYEAPKQARVAG